MLCIHQPAAYPASGGSENSQRQSLFIQFVGDPTRSDLLSTAGPPSFIDYNLMRGNVIIGLNILFSFCILNLFRIYASLASWWMLTSRHAEISSAKAGFFVWADQLHVLAIFMALFNSIGAWLLLAQGVGNRKLSIASIVVAVICLFACMLITV